MTRREALAALAVCAALVVAGAVWLAGPYGLLGSGVVLAGLVLGVVNEVKETPGAEDVAGAVPQPQRGHPVRLRR